MQTMSSERFRVPAFTFRFFLLLAATGVLTAVVLQVSGAPIWTRYFAGIVSAPFIFHAVRSVERVAPTSGSHISRGREV
jgi:hypothetical protein